MSSETTPLEELVRTVGTAIDALRRSDLIVYKKRKGPWKMNVVMRTNFDRKKWLEVSCKDSAVMANFLQRMRERRNTTNDIFLQEVQRRGRIMVWLRPRFEDEPPDMTKLRYSIKQ